MNQARTSAAAAVGVQLLGQRGRDVQHELGDVADQVVEDAAVVVGPADGAEAEAVDRLQGGQGPAVGGAGPSPARRPPRRATAAGDQTPSPASPAKPPAAGGTSGVVGGVGQQGRVVGRPSAASSRRWRTRGRSGRPTLRAASTAARHSAADGSRQPARRARYRASAGVTRWAGSRVGRRHGEAPAVRVAVGHDRPGRVAVVNFQTRGPAFAGAPARSRAAATAGGVVGQQVRHERRRGRPSCQVAVQAGRVAAAGGGGTWTRRNSSVAGRPAVASYVARSRVLPACSRQWPGGGRAGLGQAAGGPAVAGVEQVDHVRARPGRRRPRPGRAACCRWPGRTADAGVRRAAARAASNRNHAGHRATRSALLRVGRLRGGGGGRRLVVQRRDVPGQPAVGLGEHLPLGRPWRPGRGAARPAPAPRAWSAAAAAKSAGHGLAARP